MTGRGGSAVQAIARAFARFEDVVYVGLALLLAVSALALLVDGAWSLVRALPHVVSVEQVVALLDRILLILMLVEILYTVQVSLREHVLVPDPFLVVGLIAAMRRILVLTAEFSKLVERGEVAFRNAMIELGVLGALVIALVASLVLLRRRPVAERS